VLQRLGFPAIGPHRRFVTAMAVDAIGSGVFLPVSILYFLHTTSLSLTAIGLALSLASGVQLPLGPLVGGLVDKAGPKRILLAANALEAVGFAGYIFAGSFASVLVSATIVQLGVTCFWGSFSPVVATIAAPGERERWFGFLGALRNASFAVGGVVAAIAITIGTTTAYTTVVIVNGTSYVLAFVLILSAATPSRARERTGAAEVTSGGAGRREGDPPEGWGRVLRDRAYLVLVATNYTYAMSAMVLNIVIPVYLTQSLGLPGWVAGAVFSINTLMIGLGQGLAVNAMTGRVRANIVALGCLLSAVSYVILLAADWTTVVIGVGVALVAAVVYTGGELVAGPVLTALSTDAAPVHLRGRYVSLYQMSWTIAMTVAPVTLTWLLERGGAALWGVLICVALAGALLTRPLRTMLPLAAAPVTNAAVVPQPEPVPDGHL
jgi:MFS family permease